MKIHNDPKKYSNRSDKASVDKSIPFEEKMKRNNIPKTPLKYLTEEIDSNGYVIKKGEKNS